MIFLRRVVVAALLLVILPPCGYGEGVPAPVDSSVTAGATVAAGNIPNEADVVELVGQATFRSPGDDEPTPISDRILDGFQAAPTSLKIDGGATILWGFKFQEAASESIAIYDPAGHLRLVGVIDNVVRLTRRSGSPVTTLREHREKIDRARNQAGHSCPLCRQSARPNHLSSSDKTLVAGGPDGVQYRLQPSGFRCRMCLGVENRHSGYRLCRQWTVAAGRDQPSCSARARHAEGRCSDQAVCAMSWAVTPNGWITCASQRMAGACRCISSAVSIKGGQRADTTRDGWILNMSKNPRVRRGRSMASRIARLYILAVFALAPAFAAELPDVKIDAVLEGIARAANPDDVAAETIWIKDGKVRVDFDAGEGRRGRILRGNSGHVWLLMATSHRALPAGNVKLGAITRLDPQQPCRDLPFYCEQVDVRDIAGWQAEVWRYRHAGQDGPDGTDSGTFWIDAEYGLLLSFEAQDLAGRQHRMETTTIHFGELPSDTFALPESLRKDIDRVESNAADLRGNRR